MSEERNILNELFAELRNRFSNEINSSFEYDGNGNLIRYDSTYTYYYSNIEGDEIAADSIFNNFRNMFEDNYSFSTKPCFNDLFFEDSLLKYDFYKRFAYLKDWLENVQNGVFPNHD